MKAELVIYSAEQVSSIVKHRTGEIRLGENINTLKGNKLHELKSESSKYVLLGIPEDIGVRANFGRGGAYSAWNPVLSTLLNIQSNRFLSGSDILVLGHVDCTELMERMATLDVHNPAQLEEARVLVSKIDECVADVAEIVISSGKELIVIGGGHNNAYPLLKGFSKAVNSKVNCINCDAHADLRPLEGRHSGNGFSYAFQDGYLGKYSMIGLQEIFNTASVLERIFAQPESFHAITYEDIFLHENYTWEEALKESVEFTSDAPCGLELDIDLIQNIPSSAKTSSGITTLQARQYIHAIASQADTRYLHIAEAAPVLSHIKTDLKTGKLIAYLVTDYIKARNKRKG